MENDIPTPQPSDPPDRSGAIEDDHPAAEADRPFGFWIRAVDHLVAREFAAAFAAEGASRRDARLLALLGDADGPAHDERLQRRFGKRLRRLVERGWALETDGGWTLTDDGRATRARLAAALDGIRTRVADAVSDEDFATTRATLEAIARELGADEEGHLPRGGRGSGPGLGRGSGRAFGRGFGAGFGSRRHGRPGFVPGFGPEFRPEFRPGFGSGRHGRPGEHHPDQFGEHDTHGPHRFGEHGTHRPDSCAHRAEDPAAAHAGSHHAHAHGHGHGHSRHDAEQAYARGFDAGFTRGREAETA